MAVCLLDKTETRKLEDYGIAPSCRNHRHYSRREMLAKVAAGELRWVGEYERRVTETPKYMWAIRRSGPVDCWQMVEAP